MSWLGAKWFAISFVSLVHIFSAIERQVYFFSSDVMLASGIFCIDLHKRILLWNLHWMFAGCGLWHFSVELHLANLYNNVGSACSLVFLQYYIVFSRVDFYLVFDVPLSTGLYHVTLLSI